RIERRKAQRSHQFASDLSVKMAENHERSSRTFVDTIFAKQILKDHVAFVTGGGTGITGGVARALAEAGANVALVSRSIEHLDTAAKAINDERAAREVPAGMPALHGEAFPIAADVRKPDELEKAISATVDRFGQ